MNCAEFQKFLPELIDSDRSAEQESHLKSCAACSGLVADLNLISREAQQLQEVAEPSPRVWNSIEIALRREGLIREPQLGPALVPPVRRSWTLAWLAPVAALALLGSRCRGLPARGASAERRATAPLKSGRTPQPAAQQDRK